MEPDVKQLFKGMSLTDEDKELQQKMELEMKMLDGTAKLLAAAHQMSQQLEGAKTLLVCQTRMRAYMLELQRRRNAQALPSVEKKPPSCNGQVALSDIRVPLLWSNDEHFKGRGDSHRFAVFCVASIGTEVKDSELLVDVSPQNTDLSFDKLFLFEAVPSDFECEIQFFACQNNASMAAAIKQRKKLSDIPTSVGKRLSVTKRPDDLYSPKFHEIARCKVALDDATGMIRTYDLAVDAEQEDALPLMGHFCARVAVIPDCLLQADFIGILECQGTRMSCTLKNLELECSDAEHSTTLTIPITKQSSISQCLDPSAGRQTITVCCPRDEKKHQLMAVNEEEHGLWWDAIEQQILNHKAWKHACEKLMTIPDKSSKFTAGSIFDAFDFSGVPRFSQSDSSPMSQILRRLSLPETI